MNKYFISLLIASTCLLYSCNNRINKQQENILISAAHLMDYKPDSAHVILSTVNVTKLSELQYHHFITLTVRAKDKLYLNAAEDTVVFRALNYFLKKNNAKYIPYVYFVSARVQEEQNNLGEALTHYLEAVKWLDKTSNFLLNGDIYYNLARLLYSMNQYESSLLYLEQGQKYYDLANCNYDYKIHTNELFALNYLYTDELENSLSYFKLAENIAIQKKDQYNEQRIAQNMALAYRDAKEFVVAKEKCKRALYLTNDSLKIGKLQLILGSIFFEKGQNDSAIICLYKAERLLKGTEILTDLIDLNRLLSEIEIINKNDEKASHYHDRSNIHINSRKNEQKAVLKVHAKYQDNTFLAYQAKYDKHAKERMSFITTIIILSLIILVGILVGIVFYRHKAFKEKRAKEIEEQNKEIKTCHQKIEQSEEEKAQMKIEFEASVSELKNDFSFEQLLIVFQINNTAELDKILTANDINSNYRKAQVQVRLLIDSITWESVFSGLRNAHNGLAGKLEADFPDLSEKEYRIFLLSCSGFSVMGIAKILKYSPNSIQKFQTEIRKKTGILLSGSFTDFVYLKYGITIIQNNCDV